MDSPPRFNDGGSPRFTEQFDSSPQYHEHQYPSSPEFVPQDQAPQYERGGAHLGHRISNKDRPISPAPNSAGLESVWDDEGNKEVVPPQESHQRPLPPGLLGYGTEHRDQGRTCCGLSRKVFIGLLVALIVIILGVGLGAGLGVGLSKKHSSGSSTSASQANSTYLIGGAINPAYFSEIGAFNGSGIALASQSFAANVDDGTEGSLVMYFQHYTGEIRWMQLSSGGVWLGGSISEVVANDAKNSTPLSAVSYSQNQTSTWHIFYISQDGYIKQRTNSNVSNVWIDGPINTANLRPNDADSVGMQACWYGSDYGDSDYDHTPLPNSPTGNNGNTELRNEVGMHMWYASDNSTFQQWGWRDGDDEWGYQETFTGLNGHSGVGCYSWGPGTVTYSMFVNADNAVEVWWRDTNSSLTSTTSHPINEWVKTSVTIPDVNPATSLGYTNFFYAQLADDSINGYNISWAAENTSIVAGSQFSVDGEPGVSGTHLSVSALPNQGGGNNIVVFYQTNGSDITEYTRDFVAGQWTSAAVPIPAQ